MLAYCSGPAQITRLGSFEKMALLVAWEDKLVEEDMERKGKLFPFFPLFLHAWLKKITEKVVEKMIKILLAFLKSLGYLSFFQNHYLLAIQNLGFVRKKNIYFFSLVLLVFLFGNKRWKGLPNFFSSLFLAVKERLKLQVQSMIRQEVLE